jgi:flagellar biosynthetic protein FliR
VENVSSQIKVLFALVLTMMLFPTIRWTPEQAATIQNSLILMAVREAFIGLCMGYLARFFFFAFRIAGELIAQAMGLSSAGVFNPAMGGHTTAVEQLYVTVASLFYLAVNGHHYLIRGVVDSFRFLPVGMMSLNTSQFAGVGKMVEEIVTLGLRFSAPVVISLVVINIILGVVGKTVPQLNVLVTSFPINIMVGLLLLIITLPILMDQMGGFLDTSTLRVFQFVKSF